MKRMIISAAVCLAVLASIAEEKAFLCVNVKESGQLEVALGDRINSVDSLVVTGGPLDYSDFKAIWRASWYGRLTSLNLENATVVDNKIPDFALYDVQEQYVKPPILHIPPCIGSSSLTISRQSEDMLSPGWSLSTLIFHNPLNLWTMAAS